MKRKELIRYIEHHGCALAREGAKHSRYINLYESDKSATIPRHNEIANLFAIEICRQLGIPDIR
ncbi:MAG: type II toxin-antitoxin system HicA family toxin [Candidatus Magnetobacterium sp. LHC-1]|uniref:Addiction module toxin, HicA family n=1 Tax=Candidatus Magnetobacterium casense TaxID=1455061 RepID=A0ABS6RX78_9BACT|nr:type II toxin-antitoxin system HicA family toxin [Candidatus Magnetobacterium casensis]MBF0607576.1 addiction module toxin, HicA family [Nitrospirota bacterium]MBV6341236.1 addiction module toxin, HicA family [Candidatus Magnetobacterium casensis]